jgi:hypothetical protein
MHEECTNHVHDLPQQSGCALVDAAPYLPECTDQLQATPSHPPDASQSPKQRSQCTATHAFDHEPYGVATGAYPVQSLGLVDVSVHAVLNLDGCIPEVSDGGKKFMNQ